MKEIKSYDFLKKHVRLKFALITFSVFYIVKIYNKSLCNTSMAIKDLEGYERCNKN